MHHDPEPSRLIHHRARQQEARDLDAIIDSLLNGAPTDGLVVSPLVEELIGVLHLLAQMRGRVQGNGIT